MTKTLTRTTSLTGGLLPLTAETILSFGMFLNDKLKDVSVIKAETLFETWVEKQDLEDRIVVGLDYKHVRSLVHVLEQNERHHHKPIKEVLETWLERNKSTFTGVQEVAVGLTDEQLRSFANRLSTMLEIPHTQFIRQYRDWRLSQEFEIRTETLEKFTIGKPSWADAPEWANWLAKNSTGEWAWYETKPSREMGDISTKWAVPANSKRRVAFDNTDWKDSLESRPTESAEISTKKTITFDVDWSTAPKNCDVYEVRGQFANSNYGGCNLPPKLYEEKRPVQNVEIGQTWYHESGDFSEYFVSAFDVLYGSTRLDCGWVNNVKMVVYQPIKNGVVDTDINNTLRQPLETFLKEFTRVK